MTEEDQNPLISIVILSRDRYEDIFKCLNSVAKQSYENIEVIIIDNNSSHAKNCELHLQFPQFTHIYLCENLGTSLTRNAGAALAKGKYIWFLDNDTEITETDYINQLLALFAQDEKLGAVGGEAILGAREQVTGVKMLELQNNGFTDGKTIRGEYGALLYVKCLPTCNAFIKREAFDGVGGFDPWFFFYLEDLDLTFRIHQSGYKLAVFCNTPVIHWFSPGGRKSPWIGPNRNRMFFVIKNFTWLNIVLIPLLDLFYIFRLSNWTRLISYSRKADLGSEAFFRDSATVKRGLSIRKIAKGLCEAMRFPLSILLGYFAVLPHVVEAFSKRNKFQDNITTTDLRGKIKDVHPVDIRIELKV